MALKSGIGAIRPKRVAEHFQSLVDAGLFKSGELDPAESYTARIFIDTRAGQLTLGQTSAPLMPLRRNGKLEVVG